jgi:hypothetical protein
MARKPPRRFSTDTPSDKDWAFKDCGDASVSGILVSNGWGEASTEKTAQQQREG